MVQRRQRRGLLWSLRAISVGIALVVGPMSGGAEEPELPNTPSSPSANKPTEEELAAARQLFKEGKALETKGAWDQALGKFRKVALVIMTPQVRFHMALCEENLGRIVSAINGFELATEEARRAGKSAAEVAMNAPKRAAKLRKRVATVRIEVVGAVWTSRVMIDGNAVAPALFSTDIPVDPGTHKVTVENGNETTFSKELTLGARQRETIELTINDPDPAIESTEPADPSPPTTTPSTSATAPLPPPKPQRIPALVTGGVSLLALTGAGVFFALRESAFSDVRATCDAGTTVNCNPSTKQAYQSGKTYTTVAATLGGVGLAGLAAATVLWFTLSGPSKSSPQTSLLVAPTPRGVQVGLRWGMPIHSKPGIQDSQFRDR